MRTQDCTHTMQAIPPRPASLPTWREWTTIGQHKLSADAIQILDIVSSWLDRIGQRRMLMALDDRMLKDIGISRADAWREASRPFWRT
jgi:uncharacterized protein YjiS (DUF1127 family)